MRSSHSLILTQILWTCNLYTDRTFPKNSSRSGGLIAAGPWRRVESACMATIGQVGNPDHKNIKLGKAGRNRWLGKRPSVRGSAMSPGDHPHGGGEGRSPIGLPGPKTPWGKPTLGYRTRKKNKTSNKMIVRRRK